MGKDWEGGEASMSGATREAWEKTGKGRNGGQRRRKREQPSREERVRSGALELNDPNPTRPSPVTWTEPDVVGPGEADLYGEMGTQAVRVVMLGVQPLAELF